MERISHRAVVALSALVVLAVIALGYAVFDSHRWPRDDHPASLPRNSTVIVLNGGTRDSLLGVFSLDRLLTGLELVKRTDSARLVTTRTIYHGVSSDADQRHLVALAGLTDRWTILDTVRTTHEEALRLRAKFPQLTSVVVVTSPMHTRRACAVFEKLGLQVTCVASYYRNRSLYNDLSQYGYERMAWMLYKHRDWIR
jgi:uncharacterized SAM-binding protein YcdF (DUF218 family)